MQQQPAVEVTALACTYSDGTKALQDVSFTIPAGQKAALLGGRAAGKSTLLLCLANEQGFSGSALIMGLEPKKAKGIPFIMLPHPETRIPRKSLRTHYTKLLKEAHRQDPAATEEVLGRWRVADRWQDRFEHLSSGLQKRLQLAALELSAAPLAILDSPFADLDLTGTRMLRRILQQPDAACLAATHNLEACSGIMQRAIVLHEGRVIADAPWDDIIEDQPLLRRAGVL